MQLKDEWKRGWKVMLSTIFGLVHDQKDLNEKMMMATYSL
jgi:hypothetical protein